MRQTGEEHKDTQRAKVCLLRKPDTSHSPERVRVARVNHDVVNLLIMDVLHDPLAFGLVSVPSCVE
jgi:hypothetical protein